VLIYERDGATSIGDTLRSVKDPRRTRDHLEGEDCLLLSKHVSAFDVKARRTRRGDLDR